MGQLLFADQIHKVEQAKIDAARITQKSGNERRGAETALQQFSASLASTRMMDAAGSQINDIVANTAHLNDQATRGRVQGRIAAAEAMGRLAASAGAAGVGGGSVEAHNQTVRLQAAIREQQLEKSLSSAQWQAGQQVGNTLKGAVASIDNNVYRANLDYKQYVDHKKPGVFARVLGIASTVAATVFGGPQAGMAVMGAFEAKFAADNGDYNGATQNLMGAFQNGMGAARTNHATASGPKKGAVTANAPQSLGLQQDDGKGFFWMNREDPFNPRTRPTTGWFQREHNNFDSIILK